MTISNTISSFFGSSESWWDSAKADVSSSKGHVSAAINEATDAGSKFFTFNTAAAGTAAWKGFEATAGKIISTNSGLQTAAWLASFSGQVPGTLAKAAKATEVAATGLVVHPVGAMAALVGGSILASNPKASFEAVKSVGSVAYNAVAAGANLVKGAAEAGVALGLKVNEQFADKEVVEKLHSDYAELKAEEESKATDAEVLKFIEMLPNVPAVEAKEVSVVGVDAALEDSFEVIEA